MVVLCWVIYDAGKVKEQFSKSLLVFCRCHDDWCYYGTSYSLGLKHLSGKVNFKLADIHDSTGFFENNREEKYFLTEYCKYRYQGDFKSVVIRGLKNSKFNIKCIKCILFLLLL